DLRHQDQGLLALADHFLDGPQIDFRLPAPGYPVQEKRVKPAVSDGRLERPTGLELVTVELDRRRGRFTLGGGFVDGLAPAHAPRAPSRRPTPLPPGASTAPGRHRGSFAGRRISTGSVEARR